MTRSLKTVAALAAACLVASCSSAGGSADQDAVTEWGTRVANEVLSISTMTETKPSALASADLTAWFAGPFDDPSVRVTVLDGFLEVDRDGTKACVTLADDLDADAMVKAGACPARD